MKTRLLLLAMVLFAINVNAENLLKNGDLEISEGHKFENWSSGQPGSVRVEADARYLIAGAKSVRFSGVNDKVWWHQDVNVEAGATYTLTFTGRILDAFGASGGESTDKVLFGRVRAGTTTGDWTVVAEITSGTDKTVSGQFTVPEGLTTVRVQLHKEKGIAWADNLIFEKSTATSIEEVEEMLQVVACPNPSNGVFTLSAKDIITSYSVYDITGQLVSQQKTNGYEVSMNLSEYPKGLYIVKTQTAAGATQVIKVQTI